MIIINKKLSTNTFVIALVICNFVKGAIGICMNNYSIHKIVNLLHF